jgi:glycosyltransferase involved in cell wall biosynthesis
MAAKTINIAPLHTSIPELFNVEGMRNEDIDMESLSEKEIRGIPVKAGSTSSEFVTFGPEDYERFRPLMNVDDAVSKLMWVYENPDKVKEIEERAYEWVQQHSWLNMAKKWDDLFQDVYNNLEKERQHGRATRKRAKSKGKSNSEGVKRPDKPGN